MSEQLNSEPVLARDDGFHPVTDQPAVVLAPDTAPATLADHLDAALIGIDFPAFSDGRGFTLARRLRELGFVAGEQVQIVAQGPFGAEPLLVQVGYTRFALRRAEAARVRVVSASPEAAA